VRLRAAGGAEAATIFPPAPARQAALVRPGEALPVTPTIGPAAAPAAGRAQVVVVSALFADRPFSVGAAPAPDTEVVSVALDQQP
jgi:hypothetical protein